MGRFSFGVVATSFERAMRAKVTRALILFLWSFSRLVAHAPRATALHAGGRGTAVDKAVAAEWGRRAAAQKNIPAQFSLGCLLIESEETE